MRDKKLDVQFLNDKINIIKEKNKDINIIVEQVICNKLLFETSKRLNGFIEEDLIKDGLVSDAWLVLMMVYSSQENKISASEICEHLVKNKATMSRIIDSLKNKCFLNEFRDVEDRRKVILEITPKGILFAQEKLRKFNSIYDDVYKNVNIKDIISNILPLLSNIYKKEEEI